MENPQGIDMKEKEPCPCCSDLPYEECCKKYHKGALPDTALQLMRSRYSAYALSLPDYIIETTHKKNVHYSANKQEWKKQIESFSLNCSFDRLEILDFTTEDSTATVTFTAHLTQKTQDVSFTEKSTFKKIEGKWLYFSGEMLPKTS